MSHATHCSGVTLQPNTSSDTVLETFSISPFKKKKKKQQDLLYKFGKNHPAAVHLRLE